MLAIVLLSLALMVADRFWPPMAGYRAWLTLLVAPVHWLVDLPTRALMGAQAELASREALQAENERLRNDLLLLSRQLQLLEDLRSENTHLRLLLKGRERIEDRVMLAELIAVNTDPFTHQITINRGLRDGVYVGQPVLDEFGVMGQVVEAGPYTARVLLITDNQHAVPVVVQRSGFRTLALGTGDKRWLLLDHVPDTADIREGDLLVTSGLGGRFSPGYPVAEVTEVVHDPGRPFALVRAKPKARLDESRQLLLVSRQEPPPLPGIQRQEELE